MRFKVVASSLAPAIPATFAALLLLSYTLAYSYFATPSGKEKLSEFAKVHVPSWAAERNSRSYKLTQIAWQLYYPVMALSLAAVFVGPSSAFYLKLTNRSIRLGRDGIWVVFCVLQVRCVIVRCDSESREI